MISRMRRVWQKLFANRAQMIVLVPSRKYDPNDPVEAIAQFLPDLCKPSLDCAVLREKPSHFMDVIPSQKIKRKKHLVLFAHPAESYRGFEVNGPLPSFDLLDPNWWTRPYQNWEIAVAHVCLGRKVLEHFSWSYVFPAWVSYNIAIDTFLFDDRDKRLWAEIGHAIVQAVPESRSPRHLANRIVAAYLLKIAELGDFGHSSDVVHLLHFEMAYRALTFKQDGAIFEWKETGWS